MKTWSVKKIIWPDKLLLLHALRYPNGFWNCYLSLLTDTFLKKSFEFFVWLEQRQ